MKERFLFLLIVSLVCGLFAISCSGSEEEEGDTQIRCNSNADCSRNAYCDLENPQQDTDLGMLVYFCKQRQLCSSQADCPIKWKCKESEGFCITDKEASAVLCSSDSDCKDPLYPKCNLASGECVSSNGGGSENELPDANNTNPGTDQDSEENDDDPYYPDKDNEDKDADVPDNDADSSSEQVVGQTLMTENFEEGGTKWTIVPSMEGNPCWKIGTPVSGPGEAHGGSSVAATNLEGTYPNNCTDLLYYNTAITLPSSGKPEISFYAWVDVVGTGYNPFDYVEVLIKKDGEMWETTTGLYLSANTPSATSALDNTKTKITKPLKTAYYKFTGDLSAYKGKSVEIGFRFISDESDVLSGFYMDDITVSY